MYKSLNSCLQDRKNALEEYIYDARDKIDGAYSSYMLSEEKEKLKGMLTAAEDWLYSEEVGRDKVCFAEANNCALAYREKMQPNQPMSRNSMH